MFLVSSMRKTLLYLAALLTLAVHCKSSVPTGSADAVDGIPRIRHSNIHEEPFDFIDSNAVYAVKVNGHEIAKQLHLRPEDILHILKTAFDVSDKSFVQNILLEKIETIYNEGLPIYLFQDEIHNIEESPSQLSPLILLESSELCKLLRLSKFDRDTKIRRKGGLRFIENETISYHIVWSKRHTLIAQKNTYHLDEVFTKFEKNGRATFTSHPLYDSLPEESLAGYVNIEELRGYGAFTMDGLSTTLPKEVQFYLDNVIEQSHSIHHSIIDGKIDDVTTTFHVKFFTDGFQPCQANTTTPTSQALQLVVNDKANGYGSLNLDRKVVNAMLNEIDLTKLIEQLIGKSRLDELKKLDPFGLLEKAEDAIIDKIDLKVIQRFNPSGQISYGLYGNAQNSIKIAALIHGNTSALAKIKPWIEKIPSSWLPTDRGIYISSRGIIIGYGLSSDALEEIATSNDVALSSTILRHNTSFFASHELIQQYQDQIRVFDGLKGSPILADVLKKHIGDNYTLSVGVNPVSALEIVLTHDRSR